MAGMQGGGAGGGTGGAGGRMSELFSSSKKMLKGSSIKEQIGDFMKAGPLGLAVGQLTRRFKAAMRIPEIMTEWGDALKESQKRLMQFNGDIAAAMVESERRGIVRNIGAGKATAGSTRFLTQGLDDLKDEIQPIKNIITNVSNLVGGLGLRLVTLVSQVAQSMVPIVDAASGVVDWLKWAMSLEDQKARDVLFVEFVKDVKAGHLGEMDRDPRVD